MAGHSHAKNVKRKKEAGDKKKAVLFSKISHFIISAVREGGRDPYSNPSLRVAMEKAREADMPKESVERSIKRGAGEGEEGRLEPFLFEAYGPGEVAIIIEGSTDNRNRNLGEIKEILKRHNGKLADPGSVKWLFSQRGIIEVEKEGVNEEVSLGAIEAGAEDMEEKDSILIFYTSLDNVEKVKSFFLDKKIKIISRHLGWRAETLIKPETNLYKNLIEELQENESVEEVYTNT